MIIPAFKGRKQRIALVAALTGVCCYLTYYFHAVLGTGAVFTHFFYIPIILAALWWKRKGLFVAASLAVVLIVSHNILRPGVLTTNDYYRAAMFIGVAFVVAMLSERMAKPEEALRRTGEYTRHLIESSPDFQMTLDKDDRIMDVNKAFEEIVGKSRLMNAKIADNGGRCQASALAEGIVWVVDGGADVINISVEIREPSPQLEEAVNYAWSQGSLIVVAAGNDGNESPVYPAYYENCIAVAATNQDDHLALLSNHGDWVDVAAPGWDIYSTLSDNGYGYKSGTSFACPYVSGMAALLFNVVTDTNGNGRLNDEVRAAIEAGCQEIDATGVGRGRIDVAKAVAKVNYGSDIVAKN